MARRGTLLAYIRAHATLDQPLVPGSWAITQEASRWASVYPLGRPGPVCHAKLIARTSGNPTRAMFVVTGAPAVLQYVADLIAADALPWTRTWASLAALRADVGAVAVGIRAAWPDERRRAWSGPPGALIDGGPLGTLVALHFRMAGFDDDDGEEQAR